MRRMFIMNDRSPGYPIESLQDFVWPDPRQVPALSEYPEVDEEQYEGK